MAALGGVRAISTETFLLQAANVAVVPLSANVTACTRPTPRVQALPPSTAEPANALAWGITPP